MPDGPRCKVLVVVLRVACQVQRVKIKFKSIGLSFCESESRLFEFPLSARLHINCKMEVVTAAPTIAPIAVHVDKRSCIMASRVRLRRWAFSRTSASRCSVSDRPRVLRLAFLSSSALASMFAISGSR